MPHPFMKYGEGKKNTMLSVAGQCGPTSGEIMRESAWGGAGSTSESGSELRVGHGRVSRDSEAAGEPTRCVFVTRRTIHAFDALV